MGRATPFSFHCMICFEGFDPEIRYPVVLPCGHTYVCQTCAQRLEKCMTCRTLLYTLIPRQVSSGSGAKHGNAKYSTPSRSSWSSGHRGGRRVESPPPPPVKKRCPLPKNVVLLSLIEATEMVSAEVRHKNSGEGEGGSPSRNSILSLSSSSSSSSLEDDDDESEEAIKAGTYMAIGMSGTYTVATKEGLEIFETRPQTTGKKDASAAMADEDVDTMVNVFHLDHKENAQVVGTTGKVCPTDPARLRYGDRVQIVSVDDGWAKLARGYGFIKAGNHLVKVGNSVDKACKLEAMLRTLSDKRKEMRKEQAKVDNKFIRLMNNLQHSLHNDEDLTVICGNTFVKSRSGDELMKLIGDEIKEDDESRNETQERAVEAVAEENDDTLSPRKPSPLVRESTPPYLTNPPNEGGYGCFSNAVLNAYDENLHSPGFFPTGCHPTASEMSAGAQAWRDRYGRTSRTGTGIDFRTGLSGHSGMLSTHAHAHQYLESPTDVPARSSGAGRRMSAHTGLTMARPFPALTNILSALRFTNRMIESAQPPRPHDNKEEGPHRNSVVE